MLQMDMTAWVKAGTEESVGIIQDFVDPTLTSFIEEAIAEYRESAAMTRRYVQLILDQSISLQSRPSADTHVPTTPVSERLVISLRLRKSRIASRVAKADISVSRALSRTRTTTSTLRRIR